jgi:ADP-ribose pyrophosphatase YjhB (NUDIX family)
MSDPLPKDEFDRIYSKVPRLTVEVLITPEERGVLLALRDVDPCRGMWNLPGGTVRFGARLAEAVTRVAADELEIRVGVDPLLGYIEYPSHYENGLPRRGGRLARAGVPPPPAAYVIGWRIASSS